MKDILYVYGGEKASGAEIVISRLLGKNTKVKPHLLIAPGEYASKLKQQIDYPIVILPELKKLNRSKEKSLSFYVRALTNYFRISKFVFKYIKSNNIHVIHANTIVPASYLLPVIIYTKIFKRNIKWIWSDHDLKYYSGLDAMMSRACNKLYNATLVVSEAVRQKFSDKSKTFVLYNGLSTNFFTNDETIRARQRNFLKIDADCIVIGIAAVIAPRKGQLELLQSLENLNLPCKFKVFVAGKFADDHPEYGKEVIDIINSKGNFFYLGDIHDMKEFYNTCDIVINNSSKIGSEPLGTTIYEAMSCEKIVLASNTGGSSEIIENNIDGFLFIPDDNDDLRKKIAWIIENFKDLEQVRKNARIKVLRKFNIDVMVERYNSIINNI
ncbi:glycosyltransferase family 4 protein [Pedobacter sp. BMA]|uniref:glycosyltransferase family 4 protein n=1 Tax=Pedobacter sp. BMA TaxID=1663685 RepID=UPI000649A5F9|nr:glycosyltransferase family 4 protein [Pedobacter sp. BMA]KLT64012.1 hypothetical protein AB669_18265 [Pedobacter sp. BMA]